MGFLIQAIDENKHAAAGRQAMLMEEELALATSFLEKDGLFHGIITGKYQVALNGNVLDIEINPARAGDFDFMLRLRDLRAAGSLDPQPDDDGA